MNNNKILYNKICYWHCLFKAELIKQYAGEMQPEEILFYLDAYDGKLIWKCTIMGNLPNEHYLYVYRYLAAVANNLIITHGGNTLFIYSGRLTYSKIVANISKYYKQCIDLMEKRHPGKNRYIKKIKGNENISLTRSTNTSPIHIKNDCQENGYFIGVDIGNSKIKIAIIYNQDIVYEEKIDSNIKNLNIGPYEYFMGIKNLIPRLKKQCIPSGNNFNAIGIAWFGDSLNGKLLTQAADLKPWNDRLWSNDLEAIPDWLSKELGFPAFFWGDSEVLGRCLGSWQRFPNTYLLILGTSIGGAYFGNFGSYQNGINLVSRLIIDLSDSALLHTSTKTPGVLQQYAGSYGIKRAISMYKDSFDHSSDISVMDGITLGELILSSNGSKQHFGQKCIDELGLWLSVAIEDISTHYEINEVLLSGGNVNYPIGEKLISSIKNRISKNIKIELLTRPIHKFGLWGKLGERMGGLSWNLVLSE